MMMLRRTNRLKQLLASHGLELWLFSLDGEETPPSHIVEAECSHEMQNQITNISQIMALLADDAQSFGVKALENNHPQVLPPVPPNPVWEHSVSILWLSKTVFVTNWLLLDGSDIAKHVEFLFQMNIGFYNDVVLCTYNLANEGLVDPEAPLDFLSRLAQPLLPLSSVEFGTAAPVTVGLSLVPTTTHNLGDDKDVFLEQPSPDLLQALAVHPVHHDVELSIRLEADDFRGIIFRIESARSACHQKHHVLATQFASLASRLGIQLPNYIVCSLSYVAEWVTRLIGTAAPAAVWSSQPTLRYVSLNYKNTSPQEAFDQFCLGSKTLSRYAPGFASYRVMFPRGLRSNSQWDSFVAPVLALNVLRQQNGGIAPKHLMSLVMKGINQGGYYRHATNLAPCNSDTANATAIFALFRESAVE
jgi:hypothetical protein